MNAPRADTGTVKRMHGHAFSYASTELDAMAAARNYYGAIHNWFSPHLGRHTLEVGAGIGTFSELLANGGGIDRLTLIEPAGNNFPRLRERFISAPHVSVRQGYLSDFVEQVRADSLVLVNVLEHIADDLAFLRDARCVLEPRGKLLILVPALPLLFGTLDRAFEHHRRYTRKSLTDRLLSSGFRIERMTYVNLPGTISWFVVGRILRRRTISVAQVRWYDRWVIPPVLGLERVVPPPLGQSLLAVAQAI